jgi:hypothetical protein
MFDIEMKTDFRGILDILTEDTLFGLSEVIWHSPMEYLSNVLRQRIKIIKRKRVKVKTRKWRRWAASKGFQVESIHGRFSGVNPRSNVGMRTGTLIGQLENFEEPTVTRQVMHDKFGGTLYFSINSDVYVNSYPEIFNAYLISKKNIEGGIGFTMNEKMHALDLLEFEVSSLIENRW